MTEATMPLGGDSELRDALFDGRCGDPHALLGAHPAKLDGRDGIVVRAHHPGAAEIKLLLEKKKHKSMLRVDERGLFACFIAGASFPLRYELAVSFEGKDEPWKIVDPYRFPPVLGDLDLHLHGEGRHYRVYERLGAHPRELDGVAGTSFAVWAPNALRVSVVGDFNEWDGRRHPMRQMGASGIWELFVPGVGRGTIYKYEMRLPSGDLRLKTDPVAMRMEMRPATGSVVWGLDDYEWADSEWLERRAKTDARRAPMSIYEVHLGSWMRDGEGNWLGYREIADRLVTHCLEHGFTHVELMPVAEHAFDPSWGYQTTGYYAPTCRFGDPNDLRYFVDKLHQADIGVLLDWVPAHFPRDDYSLRQFDGTALYEHADPRQGEHRDWGTLIFNYGRNEVRSFLISNAMYWLEEFHFDGLRVDAVASMIYLDYSREEGDWVPNEYGGRENLHAISFLQELNTVVYRDVPGAVTIAEESTDWSGVTLPTYLGGLGFGFKWNMGWMHDTLEYFSKEAVHRSYHQNNLTFNMLYAYSENFMLPLSHDEVVHLKGSLWGKMPGDDWQKAANLRLLLSYQMGSCGKKLLFMGGEFGQTREWNHDYSLDWHEAGEPLHSGVQQLSKDLGRLYVESDALWAWDVDPEGFSWIDCNDNAHSVLSFIRRGPSGYLVFVFNFTPVPREGYRVGLPEGRRYIERVNTDAGGYGGGNIGNGGELHSEPVPWHGLGFSAALTIPPLGALILQPA